jgi:hypothetical protein
MCTNLKKRKACHKMEISFNAGSYTGLVILKYDDFVALVQPKTKNLLEVRNSAGTKVNFKSGKLYLV